MTVEIHRTYHDDGYYYYLVPLNLSSIIEDKLREDDPNREIDMIDLKTHIVFKTDEPIQLD